MATQKAQPAEDPLESLPRPGHPILARSRKALTIWVLVLLSTGFVLRMALTRSQGMLYTPGHTEAMNVAVSLATTGSFADAYGPGVGPTAHSAPLLPLWTSTIFRIFGIYTPTADVVMRATACFASALAFALLPVLAVVSGLPLFAGLLGGLAGDLLLFDFWYQVDSSDAAPFTAAALVLLCILMCRIRTTDRFTAWRGVALGFCTGLVCLLSPVALPIVIAWLIITVVEQRRKRLARVLLFSGIAVVCLVGTLTPWAIRNYTVLGSPILTRSNFWLEIHLSNNSVITANEEINFQMPAYDRMHPTLNPIQRAEVKRLGEVAYMQVKKQQAISWVTTHKRRFLELTAERFRLFWIPEMKRPIQSIAEAALTILGLAGLALLFRSRCKSAWILATLMVLYPAVYYLIMVTPRFRLPLEPFLFLLSAYCCYRLLMRLAGSRVNTVSALR